MTQLWSGIKSIITTKIKSRNLISQIRVENVDYDDPKIIADKFNNFLLRWGSPAKQCCEKVKKIVPSFLVKLIKQQQQHITMAEEFLLLLLLFQASRKHVPSFHVKKFLTFFILCHLP